MQLTQFTDYSLRVLIYLLDIPDDRLCTIEEISDAYRVSRNHLVKVVHHLGTHGLIQTVRGKNGGIRIASKVEKMNLREIVELTEPNFELLECFNAKTNRCVIVRQCGAAHVFYEACNAFLKVLENHTLADLMDDGRPARQRILSITSLPKQSV